MTDCQTCNRYELNACHCAGKEKPMLLRETLAEERHETPAPGPHGGRPMTLGECVEAEGFPALGIGDVTSAEKGTGARFNAGKPDLSLIPLDLFAAGLFSKCDVDSPPLQAVRALELLGFFQRTHEISYLYDLIAALGLDGWEECAHVFDYGRRKYAAWNWAKGMPWSVALACAARHLLAMFAGEHLDKESGLPHRGHVFCNVVMLLQYAKTYPEGNDLPPKGLL